MSVSFIVPVWREEVYALTCRPWLKQQVEWFGAELIEVRDSYSIFEALEKGRQLAKHRYLFYVHDDVRLVKPWDLTQQIVAAFTSLTNMGLIGPVGKIKRERVPWWSNSGPVVGHYCERSKHGHIQYKYARANGSMACLDFSEELVDGNVKGTWNKFAKAGLVDGFFLAEDRERLNVAWDLETFGENWHAYDMDRCFQTHQRGLEVRVPSWLFLHDCAGHTGYKGTDPQKITVRGSKSNIIKSVGDRLWLSDLDHANKALIEKWGLT